MALWVLHMRDLRHNAELAEKVQQGIVAIGWRDIEDLNKFRSRSDFKRELRELYEGEPKPGRVAIHAGVLYRYTHEIQPGDLLLLPMKATDVIKIGEFVDKKPYRDLDLHWDYAHCRDVKWLRDAHRDDFTQEALYSIGSAITLSQPGQVVEEQVAQILQGKVVTPIPGEDDDEAEEVLLEEQIQEQVREFVATQLRERKGYEYQRVVAGLLEALGYHVILGPKGKDHKSDVIAHPDVLGLRDPVIRVEVKSGNNSTSVDEVRALAGALQGNERGLFVSRMGYTRDALDFLRNKAAMSHIDGEKLVSLLLDNYEKLPEHVRDWIPLKRVWIPDV